MMFLRQAAANLVRRIRFSTSPTAMSSTPTRNVFPIPSLSSKHYIYLFFSKTYILHFLSFLVWKCLDLLCLWKLIGKIIKPFFFLLNSSKSIWYTCYYSLPVTWCDVDKFIPEAPFLFSQKKKREKKNQLDHVIWSSTKLTIANFKYKVLKIYSDHAVDFSIIFQIWY